VNPIDILAFFASLIAFFGAQRRLRDASPGCRVVAIVLLALASIPAVLFSVYYLHWIRETTLLYNVRAMSGSEFLVLPIGACAGAIASAAYGPIRVLALLGAIVGALSPFAKPLLAPLDPHSLTERWRENVCLQSSGSTCGPASAATILKALQIAVSERELATECFTTSSGTEAWYLARAIRRRGCEARFQFGWRLGEDAAMPAIVGVIVGGCGQFIPVLDARDGKYLIGDPLLGPEWLDEAGLTKRYQFTGFGLVVGRPK
jgi:hypothetical protein